MAENEGIERRKAFAAVTAIDAELAVLGLGIAPTSDFEGVQVVATTGEQLKEPLSEQVLALAGEWRQLEGYPPEANVEQKVKKPTSCASLSMPPPGGFFQGVIL